MIRPGPILLKTHLKGLVDELEASDARIAAERELQKAALDASRENHGVEPSCVRKLMALRRRKTKDPAEVQRLEDIEDLYKFLIEGGVSAPAVSDISDELSRVMALTNTSKPPKIEAIRKALSCSQGKAHKLRSLAAARLATKSSSSSTPREHEHLEDPEARPESMRLERVEHPSAPVRSSGHRAGAPIPPANGSPDDRRHGPSSEPYEGIVQLDPDSLPAENAQPAGSNTNETAPLGADSHPEPASPESRPPEPSAPALDVSPRDVPMAGERAPIDDDLEIPQFLRRDVPTPLRGSGENQGDHLPTPVLA